MVRRIKRARIKFISLCPKGANKLPTIFKADGAFELQLLSKGLDEQGELTALVYAPEFRDSQGDIASAAVIKDMLYTSAKDGIEIDIRHDGKAIAKDKVYVAEQFLVQKGDPRFEGLKDYEGNVVDPTGAWGVVLKIDDPELRKLYREGEWAGVSMGGVAAFEKSDEDMADRIVAALSKKLNPQEELMAISKDDLEAIGKVAAEAAVAAVVALKKTDPTPAPAPKDEPKSKAPEAPVFKGDPTNVEDVKKHQTALHKHDLMTGVDWFDPASVAKLQEELADLKKDSDGDGSDELKKAKADLAKSQAKLDKIEGTSRQSTNDGDGSDDHGSGLEGVSKEDEACGQLGLKMAKWANAQRVRS